MHGELPQTAVVGKDVQVGAEASGLADVHIAFEVERGAGGDLKGGGELRTEAAVDASTGAQADDAHGARRAVDEPDHADALAAGDGRLRQPQRQRLHREPGLRRRGERIERRQPQSGDAGEQTAVFRGTHDRILKR